MPLLRGVLVTALKIKCSLFPLSQKKKKRLFIEFEAKMGYLDGKIRQVVKDLD